MTDKELKYLKRVDLLDIMIAQDKEIEQLKSRLAETEKRADLAEAVIRRFLKNDLPQEDDAAAEEQQAVPEEGDTRAGAPEAAV